MHEEGAVRHKKAFDAMYRELILVRRDSNEMPENRNLCGYPRYLKCKTFIVSCVRSLGSRPQYTFCAAGYSCRYLIIISPSCTPCVLPIRIPISNLAYAEYPKPVSTIPCTFPLHRRKGKSYGSTSSPQVEPAFAFRWRLFDPPNYSRIPIHSTNFLFGESVAKGRVSLNVAVKCRVGEPANGMRRSGVSEIGMGICRSSVYVFDITWRALPLEEFPDSVTCRAKSRVSSSVDGNLGISIRRMSRGLFPSQGSDGYHRFVLGSWQLSLHGGWFDITSYLLLLREDRCSRIYLLAGPKLIPSSTDCETSYLGPPASSATSSPSSELSSFPSSQPAPAPFSPSSCTADVP